MRVKVLVRLALVGSFLGGALVPAWAQEPAEAVYTAMLRAPRSIKKGMSAKLTLTVTNINTQEDADELQAIYDEQGSEGLMEALRKMDQGMARIEGTVPRRINWVRVHEGPNGNRVVIATEGPLYLPGAVPDPETARRDTIGVITLDLVQGQGGGTLAEVSKINVTEDGALRIEAQSAQRIILENAKQEL